MDSTFTSVELAPTLSTVAVAVGTSGSHLLTPGAQSYDGYHGTCGYRRRPLAGGAPSVVAPEAIVVNAAHGRFVSVGATNGTLP